MSKLPPVLKKLALPVIGSPLFIISNPKLVIEQCKSGSRQMCIKASM